MELGPMTIAVSYNRIFRFGHRVVSMVWSSLRTTPSTSGELFPLWSEVLSLGSTILLPLRFRIRLLLIYITMLRRIRMLRLRSNRFQLRSTAVHSVATLPRSRVSPGPPQVPACLCPGLGTTRSVCGRWLALDVSCVCSTCLELSTTCTSTRPHDMLSSTAAMHRSANERSFSD